MEENKTQHVHVVGICGVTMAPLAVLYKQMGWKVTGSDRGFFPPMSTYLEKNGIHIMPGFKKERLEPSPDFVLATAFITDKNPEVLEARRRNIPVKVYADVLPDLIEKENSVIIAGDCGKTSTTALVSWILERAGYNPNFMIGGLPRNFEHGIRKTDSNWSVMEGDEYVASSWDSTPRFLYYHPKYLIITDAAWDHMDKFPTEWSYIRAFWQLTKKVSSEGVIIAHANGKNIKRIIKSKILKKLYIPVIFYEGTDSAGFTLPFPGKIWQENCAAAITLARYIGISDATIQEALSTFVGIKRRQEVRYEDKNLVIIDDNAHTPVKVKGALGTIAEMFPHNVVRCAIYEPGNRSPAALTQRGYGLCFRRAEFVILPKVSSAQSELQDFNKHLAKRLRRYYENLQYIEDDGDVILAMKKIAEGAIQDGKKVAFIFMSQKGFRGMIEQAVKTFTFPPR